MAVPNNYNFSLRDVANELPGGQSSLDECFREATSSKFDSRYQGSKNSLRNFRNYNNAPKVTLRVSPTSYLSRNNNAVAFNIRVTSNSSWQVTESVNWIRLSRTSGSGNGTVRVTLLQNTGRIGRYAYINFRANGVSFPFLVEQADDDDPRI
ncbi:MAG: BACON domain-containing protein [Bacteroidota bacterium]